MPPIRASPEAQDAGFRVGPGSQFSLFVGMRSSFMSLPFTTATEVLTTATELEREDKELHSEAFRTRSISNGEILASNASKEAAGAVEETMPGMLSRDWCSCFVVWHDVLFMMILYGWLEIIIICPLEGGDGLCDAVLRTAERTT